MARLHKNRLFLLRFFFHFPLAILFALAKWCSTGTRQLNRRRCVTRQSRAVTPFLLPPDGWSRSTAVKCLLSAVCVCACVSANVLNSLNYSKHLINVYSPTIATVVYARYIVFYCTSPSRLFIRICIYISPSVLSLFLLHFIVDFCF